MELTLKAKLKYGYLKTLWLFLMTSVNQLQVIGQRPQGQEKLAKPYNTYLNMFKTQLKMWKKLFSNTFNKGY